MHLLLSAPWFTEGRTKILLRESLQTMLNLCFQSQRTWISVTGWLSAYRPGLFGLVCAEVIHSNIHKACISSASTWLNFNQINKQLLLFLFKIYVKREDRKKCFQREPSYSV